MQTLTHLNAGVLGRQQVLVSHAADHSVALGEEIMFLLYIYINLL